MADILTAVTDAEAKVVDTVRNLQGPVVEYVRKGVKFADERLPEFNAPSFPASKLVDTQVDFLKSLLDAQRELVKAVIKTVSPLVNTPAKTSAASPKPAAKGRTTKSAASA